MRYIASFILGVGFFITGCAATLHKGEKYSPAPPPSSEQALVYFYRPHSPPLWRNPMLYVNEIKIGDLYNQGYTYIYLAPGAYSIKTDWAWDAGVPDLKGEQTFEAGKTYFVRLGGDMTFSGPGVNVNTSTSLHVLSDDQVKGEIAHCMYFTPQRKQIP